MRFPSILFGLAMLVAGCGNDAGESQPLPAPEESPARVDAPGETVSVSIEDFEPILGGGWTGQLIYADANADNGQGSVEAELEVSREGRTLTLDFSFPGSPQGDGSAPLEISEDGDWINDEMLLRREQSGDLLTLLTRQECIEGRHIATCEYLYDISETEFSIAKAYRLAGEEEQRFGHQYSFQRDLAG